MFTRFSPSLIFLSISSKLLILLIFLYTANQSLAQEIAIIDINHILQSASSVKDLEAQLAKKKSTFEEEIKAVTNKIKTMEQDLSSKKEILSPEAFNKQLEDFRKEVASEEEKARSKKNELESLYLKTFDKINSKTIEIIGQLSEPNKIDIVIPKSQTLFVKNDVQDISNQVLEALNKQLPTVNIEEK